MTIQCLATNRLDTTFFGEVDMDIIYGKLAGFRIRAQGAQRSAVGARNAKSKRAKEHQGTAQPGSLGAALDEIGARPLARRKVKAGINQSPLRPSSPRGQGSERDLA